MRKRTATEVATTILAEIKLLDLAPCGHEAIGPGGHRWRGGVCAECVQKAGHEKVVQQLREWQSEITGYFPRDEEPR